MKTCIIEGCDKKRRARGWCKMHWTRWSRHGSPFTVHREDVLPAAVRPDECARISCRSPQAAARLCVDHAQDMGLLCGMCGEDGGPLCDGCRCVDCGDVADCSGECVRCRSCFHVWADQVRAERSREQSAAQRVRAYRQARAAA